MRALALALLVLVLTGAAPPRRAAPVFTRAETVDLRLGRIEHRLRELGHALEGVAGPDTLLYYDIIVTAADRDSSSWLDVRTFDRVRVRLHRRADGRYAMDLIVWREP
jgi:hypothetical protein